MGYPPNPLLLVARRQPIRLIGRLAGAERPLKSPPNGIHPSVTQAFSCRPKLV
jgi:hypothetical protein